MQGVNSRENETKQIPNVTSRIVEWAKDKARQQATTVEKRIRAFIGV